MKVENYKRTESERGEDLLLTMELKDKGYSFRDIANHITSQRDYSISHNQICLSYSAAMRLSPDDDRIKEAIEQHRAKEVLITEFIKDEAVDSWNKSKGIIKETTKKGVLNKGDSSGEGKKIERQEVTEKTIDSAGNPAYLALALKASERKARLLGLDSPIRTENKNINLIPDNIEIKVSVREVNLPTSELDIEEIDYEDVSNKKGNT